MKSRTAISIVLFAVLFGSATANADTFQLYSGGDNVDTGTAFRLTSDVTGAGYGGMYLAITGSLTVSGLTNLSADYMMTEGTFTNGSPRFTLFDPTETGSAWIYWGTPAGGGTFTDPNAGSASFANTGNLASLSSTDIRVYDNNFGGDGHNGNIGETWAAFVASQGSTALGFITLDLDGGLPGNPQQALVNNFTVNNEVFTAAVPEPSTWVMMIFGFAGLGFTAYRKRTSVRFA